MNVARWTVALGVVVAMMALAWPLVAQERDSDGTRMQARQVDVGSTHSDRLDPPDQKADWRMIRLDEQRDIEIELRLRSSDVTADLRLTSATGDELEAQTATNGTVTIEQTLLAGIYYIAVESSDSLSYELAIR